MALISITGVLIALRYDFLSQTPETRRLLLLLLVILGGAILALATTFIVSGFNLVDKLPQRFPAAKS